MPEDSAVEAAVGVIIVEGQRSRVSVRSVPEGGTWHNALLFRRDGKLAPGEPAVVGIGWHAPPATAQARARELTGMELMELYRRAIRPRPPLI
jgi:hypothetical protein